MYPPLLLFALSRYPRLNLGLGGAVGHVGLAGATLVLGVRDHPVVLDGLFLE